VALERGRGKRYSEGLRVRAASWLRQQVANGRTIGVAVAAIDLDVETARRWLRAAPPAVTALVPVEVVTPSEDRHAMSIVSPAGYRVDELSIAYLAAAVVAADRGEVLCPGISPPTPSRPEHEGADEYHGVRRGFCTGQREALR